jgi:transcriptional regulator with XRE-family HTH domain
MDAREQVAGEVRALMGRHRVSQTALARVLGLSQSSLSARLCGELPFDLDDLVTVAKHFNVSVTSLLGSPKSVWNTGDELRSMVPAAATHQAAA